MNRRNLNLGKYIVPEDTRNGVCLEVGANVGSFTEKYMFHFNTIHYYEPLTECFNYIKSKIGSYSHIVGQNLAGYKTSGEVLNMLLHQNRDSGSTGLESPTLNEEWTDNIIQSVTTIALEDMIANLEVEEIDYCKSDCETSEYSIFLGKDLSKLKYIGIELHWQMGHEKYNELVRYFLLTHELIHGDATYTPHTNKEVLFKRLK